MAMVCATMDRAGGSKGSVRAKMPIQKLIQDLEVQPEHAAEIVKAYRQTLHTLCLVERCDPLTEIIASKVIQIGLTGLRDPAQISNRALNDLRGSLGPLNPNL